MSDDIQREAIAEDCAATELAWNTASKQATQPADTSTAGEPEVGTQRMPQEESDYTLGQMLEDANTKVAALREQLAQAQKFKAFVHNYLTQHGVPEGDPTNQHQIEGCRIGARLDLLLGQLSEAQKETQGQGCDASAQKAGQQQSGDGK